MKRVLLMLSWVVVMGVMARAQATDDSKPATSNLAGAQYPLVHSDLRVTFRPVRRGCKWFPAGATTGWGKASSICSGMTKASGPLRLGLSCRDSTTTSCRWTVSPATIRPPRPIPAGARNAAGSKCRIRCSSSTTSFRHALRILRP